MRAGRPRSAVGRRSRSLSLAALFLLLLLPAPARGQEEDLFGKRVVSVAYRSDGPVERSLVETLSQIAAGQPLTEHDTAATIRNLFATSLFADIWIEASPAGDGVAVQIRLFRAYRMMPVRFEGRRGLSREDLARALPFSEGAVYSGQAVTEGAASIKRRLEADGFLKAAVTPDVVFDRARFDARVTYRVDSGPRARVARALFDGDTAPYGPARLLEHARLKSGDSYRQAKAQADASRIQAFLHREGRLKAAVELIAAQPTPDGRVMPVYRITVGPEVVFQGKGIEASKLRREVHPLAEEQLFNEDLILQYVEGKRRGLQRKGYYRARVTYSFDEKPGRVTVSVTIEKGSKYAVERIAFQGDRAVPAADLRRLMVTRPRGLPLLRPGHLVDEVLQADLSTILGYYQTRGWIAAKVGPARVTDAGRPGRLDVTIPIEEGPRAIVQSRKIAGAEHGDLSRLEKILEVKPGRPFNPSALRRDVAAIQADYQDRGWSQVSVREQYRLSADRTKADVTYAVEEGWRSFFGKTIVRGSVRTDSGRIRHLIAWEEGSPFSEEEILETQRKLTRAGVFRRVEIRPQPADPETRERNVEVDLREGRPLSLLYGLGYQYAPGAIVDRNDPFLVGGVSYNNLWGTMRSAGLEGQLSLSGRFRLQASFRDPYLFGGDYPFTGLIFAAREPIQKIDLQRLGWVNEVSHFYGNLRVTLRAEYQRIRPVNPANLSLSELPRADQPIEQATVGPAFLYDRRDDVVDPHRGYYLTLAGKYAFPLLSAEARYGKALGQAAFFQPIGRSVFAFSARAGGIFRYGPASIPVPLAERFFAGGRSTERAFDTDLLGIPADPAVPGSDARATVDYDTRATLRSPADGKGSCGKAFPELSDYDCDFGPRIIGGDGFLAFNAELRFPIAGDLGGTLFYDAAQVWREFSQIDLRLGGGMGLRQGVGFGLRYMLPVGPLRVEYAWKLNPRTIPFNVVDVTDKAHPAILRRSDTRESRGQFFISIGYPF